MKFFLYIGIALLGATTQAYGISPKSGVSLGFGGSFSSITTTARNHYRAFGFLDGEEISDNSFDPVVTIPNLSLQPSLSFSLDYFDRHRNYKGVELFGCLLGQGSEGSEFLQRKVYQAQDGVDADDRMNEFKQNYLTKYPYMVGAQINLGRNIQNSVVFLSFGGMSQRTNVTCDVDNYAFLYEEDLEETLHCSAEFFTYGFLGGAGVRLYYSPHLFAELQGKLLISKAFSGLDFQKGEDTPGGIELINTSSSLSYTQTMVIFYARYTL